MSRGANPQLDAIRADGVPDLLDPSRGGSSSQLRNTRGRRPSNASSYFSSSGITVPDRGDELYAETRPPRPELPPPRSRSSLLAEELAQEHDQPLWKRLTTLQSESSNDGPLFFPRGAIDRIFTREVIQRIIKKAVAERTSARYAIGKEESYTDVIRAGRGTRGENGCFIRILAILVLIGKELDIVSFVDHDLSDADLPLDAFKYGNFKDLRRKGDDSSIEFLGHCGWDERDHDKFEKIQWSVIAPFFAPGTNGEARFYPLSKSDILPWTKIFRTGQHGGFGEVFRVEIHPCNHNFDVKKVRNSSSHLVPIMTDNGYQHEDAI